MTADPPRAPPTPPTAKTPVAARLVTSAPGGLLRLEFTPPPDGAWTLVRAELARRLAEQAVSQAATVSDADLATFARGKGLPRRPADPESGSPAEPATEPKPEPTPGPARDAAPSPGSGPVRASSAPVASPAEALLRADMLTGEALAPRLGLSRATVALRRQTGRLLALESGTKRGFRYPAWQIRHLLDPATRDSFEEALRLLAPRGSWATFRFFTMADAADGRAPLELLEAGDVAGFRSRLRANAG